jgi:hypothetical protein
VETGALVLALEPFLGQRKGCVAGKGKAIPAGRFLVGKNVEIFCEIRAEISIFPLVNPGWNLISNATPYLSIEIWETPCSPGGFICEQ